MLSANLLPDVASHRPSETPLPLQWVGMEAIAVPISLPLSNNHWQKIPAKADIYVNLANAEVKGIHMSRLHAILNQLAEHECNKATLNRLLNDMIHSQRGISDSAKIKIAFELLLEKKALLTDESGFQSYPCVISAEQHSERTVYSLDITIPYSSTCPCSASLSQQLLGSAIDRNFPSPIIEKQDLLVWLQSNKGSIATPHSQRSYAYLKLTLSENALPDLSRLIAHLEETIGTPVQTAVKRNDEQEFARLNAQNLMFCEDAARRIKYALDHMDDIVAYWFKIEHQESLHAHNAVVIDQKIKDINH